jgi:hypothetical protein
VRVEDEDASAVGASPQLTNYNNSSSSSLALPPVPPPSAANSSASTHIPVLRSSDCSVDSSLTVQLASSAAAEAAAAYTSAAAQFPLHPVSRAADRPGSNSSAGSGSSRGGRSNSSNGGGGRHGRSARLVSHHAVCLSLSFVAVCHTSIR